MPQYDPATGESAGVNSPVLYELLRRGHSFSGHERHCCFLNTGGGRFANISAVSGFDFPDDGRGMSLVDWDFDGDLDVWLINRNGPQVRFLRNESPHDYHFLAVRLQGTSCNRDAIGARIELVLRDQPGTKLLRTLRAGDAYLAQSSKWVHFGLGPAKEVERLVVHWPGGRKEEFLGDHGRLEVDQRYSLVQGKGRAEPWTDDRPAVDFESSTLKLPASSDVSQTLMVYPVPLPILKYQSSEAPQTVASELPRPMLLNLWASWCPPCVIELHEFSKRKDDLAQANLDILALSVDGLGSDLTDKRSAQRLLAEMEFPFPSGHATDQMVDRLQMVHDVLFDFHGALPVPTSLLLDVDGQLVAIYKGPVDVDRVLEDVGHMQLEGDDLRSVSQRFPGRWLGRQPGHRFLRIAANLLEAGYPQDAGLYLLKNERYFGHAPIYSDVATKVGIALIGKRAQDLAAQLFRGALQANPNSPSIRFYLAQTLESAGRDQEAAAEYAKVIELDPESTMGNFRLGILLAKHGRIKPALTRFQRTVELKPAWAAARFKLAMALMQLNQPDEALIHLQKTIQLQPVDQSTQMQLARILATHADARFRNGAEAVRWAEQVCESTNYTVPMALDTLASAYAENGEFEKATEAAKKAVRLANSAKQYQFAKAIESRLRDYQRGQPFRVRP